MAVKQITKEQNSKYCGNDLWSEITADAKQKGLKAYCCPVKGGLSVGIASSAKTKAEACNTGSQGSTDKKTSRYNIDGGTTGSENLLASKDPQKKPEDFNTKPDVNRGGYCGKEPWGPFLKKAREEGGVAYCCNGPGAGEKSPMTTSKGVSKAEACKPYADKQKEAVAMQRRKRGTGAGTPNTPSRP